MAFGLDVANLESCNPLRELIDGLGLNNAVFASMTGGCLRGKNLQNEIKNWKRLPLLQVPTQCSKRRVLNHLICGYVEKRADAYDYRLLSTTETIDC